MGGSRDLHLVDLGMFVGVVLLFLAFFQGAGPAAPGLAVVEGMIASLFWMISAIGPHISVKFAGTRHAAECASAIAAGATGGAVMSSIDHGWNQVALLFS